MTPYQDPIRSADHRVGEALTIFSAHSGSANARSMAGTARNSDGNKRKAEYTVFVVNDMPDQLEMMQHLCCANPVIASCRLLTARRPRRCPSRASRLVISDVSMPRMNGIEMCVLMRENEDLKRNTVS